MKNPIQIALITALTLLITACGQNKHKDQALYDEYHETMCFMAKIPEMMKGEIAPEMSSKIQISSKRNTELAGELMKLPKDSEHASMFKQSLDMGTCGQSNSVKTSQSQPATIVQPQTALTPASAKSGSHTVGEVVQGDGFTVVLNDAQFTGSIKQLGQTDCNELGGRIRLSAGIPSSLWSFQIIASVNERFRFSTSYTRLRRPIIGTKSFGVKPDCSMRNLIASTGSGRSMGKCLAS